MDDTTLVQEFALEHSEKAFEEIVKRYSDLVYSVCYRCTEDRHLAEDTVQAVFMILCRKAGTIRKRESLASWLMRTAYYASSNALRIEMNRRKHEKEAGEMNRGIQSEEESPWRELMPLLDRALLELRSMDREAVILRFFRKKQHSEVGEELGISEDAARKRVDFAVEKLSKVFSRRGVNVSSVFLASALMDNGVQSASPGLAAECAGLFSKSRGAAMEQQRPDLIVKGVMKMMLWKKLKIWGAAVLTVLAVTAGFTAAVDTIRSQEGAVSAQPAEHRTGSGADTGSLPAFPGAEGYGAASKGGRGGRVIKVTNLNPSGPGSLQWACNQDGPRIIVFDVSGIITPPNRSREGRWLSIKEDRVTIAGQTAPGAGITIEGMLSVSRTCARKFRTRDELSNKKKNVHDVVIRFLRLRPMFGQGNLRTLETRSCRRFIADHVSGSWSLDQCFNAGGDAEEMTFQWCGIEETDLKLEGTQPHAFGLFGSYNTTGNLSLHHCIMAHHMGRAPDFDENYHVDYRNNVQYNLGFDETVMRWFNRSKTPNRPYAMFNIIGNTWRVGPGGIMGGRAYMPPLTGSRQGFVPSHRTGRYFFRGNRFDRDGIVGKEKYSLGSRKKVIVDKPFPMPPVTTHTVDEAYELVCAHAGCLPRDAVTARTVAEIYTRTGEFGRNGPDGGLMEGLTPGTPPLDTDNDGMPDAWEKKNGLDPNDPEDSNKTVKAGASPDDRHRGYTYIEYYINDLADRKIAEALTDYRLNTEPPKPWDRPAALLSPNFMYKSLDEMVKAVQEQNSERNKDRRKRWSIQPGFNAVQQLGRMGEKSAEAVPELVKGLSKGPEDHRAVSFAAWALGAIGPAAKEAVPDLIRAIKSEQSTKQGKLNFRTYGFLAWALGRIGVNEKQALEIAPVLGKLVHGPDVRSRAPAAWALSRLGASAQPALSDLLNALREHNLTGYHAAQAIAHIGKPAIPGLVHKLKSSDVTICCNTSRALMRMGPQAKEAVPALISRFKKAPSGRARGRIALALSRIAPENRDVISVLSDALKNEFLDTRVSGAMALGKCGPAAGSAVPALDKALRDKRAEVKRAAAQALGKIGKAAVSVLANALTGDDPFVRKYAARALSKIGKGAVPVLIKALSDNDAEVRREAVWSLTLIASENTDVQRIFRKLKDKDSDYMVRYAAGRALTQ